MLLPLCFIPARLLLARHTTHMHVTEHTHIHTRKYSESVKCTTHARAHWIPQPHVKTFSFVDVVVLQTKSKALTNERTWIRFGHCCKYILFLAVRLAVRIVVLSENVLVDDFGFDRVFCICFLYFIVFL